MFSQALPPGSPGLPTTNLRAWAAEQAGPLKCVPDVSLAVFFSPEPGACWWLEQRPSWALQVALACLQPAHSFTALGPGDDLFLHASVSLSLEITTIIVSLFRMERCAFCNSPFP